MEMIAPLLSIIDCLVRTVSSKISLIVNLDQRIQSLTAELKKLKDTRDDLKMQIEMAELEDSMCTKQAQGWLERVEVIEYQAGSMADDLGQRKQCFCIYGSSCSSRYELSKLVVKMLREIKEAREEGNSITIVADGSLPPPVVPIPTRPTVGQEQMMEKIQQILRDDEAGIIGIVGMGGVGKTTLLKNINNEFLTTTHSFDVVIWVVVSKDFVAEKIQQAIGSRLGLPWEETESQEQRATKIYRIMVKKKFLLLLDDVWEGFDLEKFGVPHPSRRSKYKVMFTTRSMDVCSDMDAHRKLRMDFLREHESWQLFSDKIGGREILDEPSIRPLAEAIVKKCKGLPLALITMGRAMAYKETVEEWQNAVEIINNSPSELRGMEDVFTLLKFSYDNLNDDRLRDCFLYCSLFPDEHSIEKKQLIEYWIGEGILDGPKGSNVYYKGHSILGSLKATCLLESGEGKTQVKMHDVVRSFAIWIASEKFIVQASAGLNESPETRNWRLAQRISLLDNSFRELSAEIPDCPDLSTLLLQQNSGLTKVPNGFFQEMPVLKVLDLSFTSLKEIPASIGRLAELRHLDLSGTKITALPKELGLLSKLRHLDLQRTYSLSTIPREAMAGLSQMRVLNLYHSYGFWEAQDAGSGNEVQIDDLECMRHLTTLGITVTEFSILQKVSNIRTLLKCIEFLLIRNCEDVVHIQLTKSPGDGDILKRLSINDCDNLKFLVIGKFTGDRWLPSLEVLALVRLPQLNTIWGYPVTSESLLNLQSVSIWYCHKLKNVSWVLKLPKLEVLYVFFCQEMEEVVSDDFIIEGDSSEFPRLRTVSIRDLPELRSFSQGELAFPSLERIAVIDCPKLKRLPLKVAENISNLPTVYGNKEWWDGLEWNNVSTKSAFVSHFMPAS